MPPSKADLPGTGPLFLGVHVSKEGATSEAVTIEVTWKQPGRVKWINDLKHPLTGNVLRPIPPAHETFHRANTEGGTDGWGATLRSQAPLGLGHICNCEGLFMSIQSAMEGARWGHG